MYTKRIFFIFFVLILLAGSIKVDAASTLAANPPANEPWTTEHVDWYPGSGVGTNVSIAHHPTTGIAYISYYDYLNNELWMAHEVDPGTGDCHNNDDWDCQVIDSEGDVGKYNSIDIVRVPSNYPTPAYTKIGISYYDATNGALKYASYRSFPFPGSWTIDQVDQRVWVGHETRGTFSSMKFNADDIPVISYHAMSDSITEYGSIKLATYVSSGGSGCNSADGEHWVCETIDRIDGTTELDHGTYTSLDFTYDGVLQVAFYNADLNSLDTAWYQGFGGSCSNTEWGCTTIDDGVNRGQYVSLHSKDSPSDKMRLAYYNAFNGMLRYAESVGSGGNCTSSAYNCYEVDEIGMPIGDIDISLDVDSMGYPIIAYTDASEDLAPLGLNIARPALAYGEDWGNCGDVPPGDLFQYWTCKSLDNGESYADEARFVAVSVSPAGLATVAYSEYNNYDDETYLKVAQQHFMNYLPLIKK